LRELNPAAQVVHDTHALRPSFLSSITAVIDLAPDTPHTFLRDLVVRSASVVLVGREPTNYSLNAVLVDRTLGASCLARQMMLDGHRKFIAVERRGSTAIADAIRAAARRYAPDATVEPAFASEASGAIDHGATAVICDSAEAAAEVRAALERGGVAIPARASIAAIGTAGPSMQAAPCTGYFVTPQAKADAIIQVLRDTAAARRPSTLWLTGVYVNAGTTGPTEAMVDPSVRLRFSGSNAVNA
jgi:DNA-binding LacI/PurR family transcriptional regulator